MLDSLYELVVYKKDYIKKKLSLYNNDNINPSEYWLDYSFSDIADNIVIAAGDGSLNQKKYLSFNLFAVAAESLIYNGEIKTLESSNVDIIPKHKHLKDRLRNYMSIFELKTAIKTFKSYDIDYYLLDGSLLGSLIRPYALDKSLTDSVKRLLINKYFKKLEQEMEEFDFNNDVIDISSKKFFKEIEKELDLEDQYDPMIYLENIEHLILISYLLSFKNKIIAISKTSSSREYFDDVNTDIAIFSIFSKKEGYTKPKYVDISKTSKRDFTVKDDFFREITFTIFYARLEDNANILKFELPYVVGEEEIVEILSKIKKYSVDGYPYLLKKAHNDVVITNKDMDRLEKILGILERTGREML